MLYSSNKALLGFITLICFALINFAQAEEADITIFVDDLSTSKTQISDSRVQIMTRNQIIEGGYTNLADALSKFAGIRFTKDTLGNGTTGVIDLRGFGDTAASNTRILLNGRSLNNPTLEAPNLNLIPLNSIERIEVINGGSSVLFGSGAVGGVINLVTISADSATMNSISTSAGAFGSASLSAAFIRELDDDLRTAITVDQEQKDGYRHHTDFARNFISIDTAKKLNNQTIRFSVANGNEDRLGSGAARETALVLDRKATGTLSDAQLQSTDFALTHETEVGRISLTNAVSKKSSDQNVIYFQSWGDEEVEQSTTVTTIASRAAWKTENTNWITGVEFSKGSFVYTKWSYPGRLTVNDDDNSEQNLTAIYVRGQENINNRNQLMGFRLEQAESKIDSTYKSSVRQGTETEWAAEYVYSFAASMGYEAYIGANRNFRFPVIDEHRYPASNSSGTYVAASSPLLKTQTSTEIETGIKHESLTIKLFHSVTDNEIRLVTPYDNGNVEEVTRSGLEISYSQKLRPSLDLNANLSQLLIRVTDGPYSGTDLPDVPRQTAQMELAWRLSDELKLSAGTRWVGKSYPLNDFTNSYSRSNSYAVSDVQLSYSDNGFSIVSSISNVGDREYDLYRISGSGRVDRTPAEPIGFSIAVNYDF